MAAKIVTLANAIVSQLNTDFVGTFTAVRSYRPAAKLDDLATVAVTVVPKSMEYQPMTRYFEQVDHTVEIGVQQRVATTADIDTKTDLVEQIGESLRRSVFTSGADKFHVLTVEVSPLVAIEHLDELNVFSSVVSVVAREARAT